MSRSTISTFELFERFPDEKSARAYIERRLWKCGIVCPKCGTKDSTPRKGRRGFHLCNPCRLEFTVRTGTIFGRSHVPLHKWVYAMYLLVTAREGISSLQLSKEIGVKQHTAWFMLQRLREACGAKVEMLHGTVEADETVIGGLEDNKHMSVRLRRGVPPKTVVIGMRERGGRTVAKILQSHGGTAIRNAVTASVGLGTRLMADENPSYTKLGKQGYEVQTVKHVKDEYVRGDVHTNGIESVWAVMKRGLHGVYHHASKKHLQRYMDEFAFRLNEGNVGRHTFERLDSLVDAVAGKRITYEELTENAD
jgi:transposase-like protein